MRGLAGLLGLIVACAEPESGLRRRPVARAHLASAGAAVVGAHSIVGGSPGPGPGTTPVAMLVSPRWPDPTAALSAPTPYFPPGFKKRVYVDAGHGAQGNHGAQSALCEHEESFTFRVAEALGKSLTQSGAFEVRYARPSDERVPYERRVREAEAWGADALVSLHFDARGWALPWSPAPGLFCYRNDLAPGFAVLFSEDGNEPLVRRRSALAQAVASRMAEVGFLPYDGEDYPGHYVADGLPGVFINRPGIGRRIFMLRRPRLPSIIIETHHGLDLEEVRRWKEPRVLEAFAAAVSAALVDALE